MLKQGDKVVIRCPSGHREQFSEFFHAFDGREGKIIHVDELNMARTGPWVRLDITRSSGPQEHITVRKSWLSRLDEKGA